MVVFCLRLNLYDHQRDFVSSISSVLPCPVINGFYYYTGSWSQLMMIKKCQMCVPELAGLCQDYLERTVFTSMRFFIPIFQIQQLNDEVGVPSPSFENIYAALYQQSHEVGASQESSWGSSLFAQNMPSRPFIDKKTILNRLISSACY